MKQYYHQQGDVLLTSGATIPATAKPIKEHINVIKEGEHTGHAHRLFDGDFQLLEEPSTKERFLRVVRPTMLRHEEHLPQEILPGDYYVGDLIEWDPFSKMKRAVVD